MCKGECTHCPFAHSEASEYAQNLGCLPDPFELIELKRKTGHNWSCHEDASKMCVGYATFVKRHAPELNVQEGNLINADVFLNVGEETALFLANNDINVKEVRVDEYKRNYEVL